MADLYLGFAVIGALTVFLFFCSLWISHKVPRLTSDMFGMLIVVGMFFYIQHLWYSVCLTTLLPYSNLIVVGNWFPLAAGLLGGFAWRRVPGRFVRKSLSVASLAAVAGYAAISPTLGELPACGNVWDDEICVQTTSNTCTPACAATLLRLYGIDADEADMAELCLTREGTTWMGLYRGLKRMTGGTRWDVEVLECGPDQLLAISDSPMILSVGLNGNVVGLGDPRVEEWGWRPGAGHSVVMLGKDDANGWRIADPAPGYGAESWSAENLRTLFRGTAIRLVERS
jgi:hypothetical protein